MMLCDFDILILRSCKGEVVQLPYDEAQRVASARLEGMGLIQSGYDDDQPTSWITDAGGLALQQHGRGYCDLA
jgi:hypothetical protein